MNIILLSGGSGKRLWPLSNGVRSKQFLKIFKDDIGNSESMIQRMFRKLQEVDSNVNIVVATSQEQKASLTIQLGCDVHMSIEPERRDTFPAIALASCYMHDVQKLSRDSVIVVCPVDPLVDDEYYRAVKCISEYAEKSDHSLTLMGIEPTYPSTKYGYILPDSSKNFSKVLAFKEKPTEEIAAKYISRGALWNAGIFAFHLDYLLDILKHDYAVSTYQDLLDNYSLLPRLSFDYAVVEKNNYINVMRYSGTWKDLGTWNTFTEAMVDEVSGNATAVECINTHIVNELQIPLLALGTHNLAIAATADGILITDKNKSHKLKEYVTDKRPMYERREWGEYQVLDCRLQDDGDNSLTKHLVILPGKHISYQKHRHRYEMWTVIEGDGRLILDGNETNVSRGCTVYIEPGTLHGIEAKTELHIIEVQVGDELTEVDIERFDWDW